MANLSNRAGLRSLILAMLSISVMHYNKRIRYAIESFCRRLAGRDAEETTWLLMPCPGKNNYIFLIHFEK